MVGQGLVKTTVTAKQKVLKINYIRLEPFLQAAATLLHLYSWVLLTADSYFRHLHISISVIMDSKSLLLQYGR